MDREIRTILLVDGSASLLFSIGMLLKRLEYRVETARSAEDALRKMEDHLPSIVLTETALPGMRGSDLLKRIKDDHLRRSIPVVMLTGERDRETQDACMRLGCAAYLLKPVDPDLLYRTLQTVSETIPRAHVRLKTSLQVTVGDGTPMGGASRDELAIAISEGGMYVSTLYPQPQGALTPVRIFLPHAEIRALTVVLYSFTKGAGHYHEAGMGMKFLELADADRESIRQFIREQLTRDIAPPESSGTGPPDWGSVRS